MFASSLSSVPYVLGYYYNFLRRHDNDSVEYRIGFAVIEDDPKTDPAIRRKSGFISGTMF